MDKPSLSIFSTRLSPPTYCSSHCQPHTSSNMENMTSPASNINKPPYRGVTSRSNSRLQWRGRGGGGDYIQHLHKQRYAFQIVLSESRQIANIVNYPGDYRHKSGDQKKQLKIWRLPDYPGELTALSVELLGKAFHS